MSAITKMLGLPDTASEAEITSAITKREADAAAQVTKTAAEKLAEVQKALDEQTAFAAMSDIEKAFYAKLEKADSKAAADFMAKKPADKKKQMNDADADDEVMKMAGVEVRKSDVGATQFAVMKALAAENEAQAQAIAKAADRELTAEIKADIAKNFSHVAGTEAEKVELLKALHNQPESVRKAQRAILASAEALAKSAFTLTGHGGGLDANPDSPEALVEKRVQEMAIAKGISEAEARVAFSDTPEFQDIMKRAQ